MDKLQQQLPGVNDTIFFRAGREFKERFNSDVGLKRRGVCFGAVWCLVRSRRPTFWVKKYSELECKYVCSGREKGVYL